MDRLISTETIRRQNLSEWIQTCHRGQKIRKTDEDYFNHLLRVACEAAPYAPLAFEIGICHDLLEDTETTSAQLLTKLVELNYEIYAATQITEAVVSLTDVFTKNTFPFLNKKQRKKREAERLESISPVAQTIKYADLTDNINWMLVYDRKHLKNYLLKKHKLVTRLKSGNALFRNKLLSKIELILDELHLQKR